MVPQELSHNATEPVCECSKEALETMILPGDYECGWNKGLLIFLYALALAWMFFGAIAIVANMFMEAIEVITSKRVLRKTRTGNAKQWVLVWNPTVANLTLMALGSSLPEIMLSVVEVFRNKFFSSELGPGVIVGSAAFNLLIIIAICVACVPTGQLRRVDEPGVFLLTAVCSVLAYFWLWVVLTRISPDVVTLWEAIVTLVFMPVLVGMAYAVDQKYHVLLGNKRIRPLEMARKSTLGLTSALHGHVNRKQAHALVQKLHPHDSTERLSDEEIAQIGAALRKKTRTQVRAAAIGKLLGRRSAEKNQYSEELQKLQLAKLHPELAASLGVEDAIDRVGRHDPPPVGPTACPDFDRAGPCCPTLCILIPQVRFAAKHYTVCEGEGSVSIELQCVRPTDEAFSVAYKTRDGTVGAPAVAGKDYEHAEGVVNFEVGETKKTIKVKLIDDMVYEPDETFEVALATPRKMKAGAGNLGKADFNWGIPHRCTVTIVDDDFPGRLRFGSASVYPDEQGNTATLHVLREDGGAGNVKVRVTTDTPSGEWVTAGTDYTPLDEWVTFGQGQMDATVKVSINDDRAYSLDQVFTVTLSQPSSGVLNEEGSSAATLDETRKQCTVHLCESKGKQEYMEHVSAIVNEQLDMAPEKITSWKEQFQAAIAPEEMNAMGWALHIFTGFWKILFAITPPPGIMNGWPCFFVCIAWIAVVTVIVTDLAVIFGCLVGLKQSINAITLVALGTSLPDTFASKAATISDPTADAAVGNVTGSNCVNVFLGVGLPWVISTVYWSVAGANEEWQRRYGGRGYPEGAFVVEAKDLNSSVTLFMVCSFVCLATLGLRRKTVGGELGGPVVTKYATAALFVALWIAFVLISALQAYGVLGYL